MQSLISLTFDDGLRCQFEKALPILNRHRFPATFFLIANTDATHDRWTGQHENEWWKIDWRDTDIKMLEKAVQEGHEIGSHSVTHDPRTIPNQPDFETRESKRIIETKLDITVSSFCYPFYWTHSCLAGAAKNAGYAQARGGSANSYYTIPAYISLDRFNIDCRQISNGENVAGWVRPGHWHVLTYHAIGNDRDGFAPITVEQFTGQMEELAKQRDSGAVDVVTFKDGAARVRQ